MSGYYFEGLTMKQLGAALGKSESRISQIVSDVLKRLRLNRNYETEREAI
jgi:DNA-directed RNA polymerase specialized sigma subunit